MAHVKWFVGSESFGTTNGSSNLFGHPYLAYVILVAALIFLSAGLIHRYLITNDRIERALSPTILFQTKMIIFFQRLVGCILIVNFAKNTIIAPHFFVTSEYSAVIYLELLVGILLIINRLVHLACFLSLIIFSFVWIEFGVISSLEYFNFVGMITLFALVKPVYGQCRNGHDESCFNSYQLIGSGVTVYRLTLGIALITLGFSEKLLNPALALKFMADYPNINFMQALGFEFSDSLFVLCCGVSEVLFGAIYLAGFVTRINTIVLGVFLGLSNGYFAYVGEIGLAVMELIGHLPLIAGALLLIFSGAGIRLSDIHSNIVLREIS